MHEIPPLVPAHVLCLCSDHANRETGAIRHEARPLTALSASQIGLWKMCPTRWAKAYREGIREAPGAAAQAGTLVHEQIELSYQGQTIDPALRWKKYAIGKAALAIQGWLPADVLAVEHEFLTTLEGVEFKGIADLVTADTVLDHKTTSSLKWAKKVSDLEDDVQRLLYSQVFADVRHVQWTYFGWKEQEARPVKFDIDRAKDKERFKLHVLQPAEEILSAPVSGLHKNKDACKMFPPNGCAFQDECWPDTMSNIVRKNVNLVEKLKLEQANFPVLVNKDDGNVIPTTSTAFALHTPGVRHPSAPSVLPVCPPEEIAAELARLAAPEPPKHLIQFLFLDCLPLSPLDGPLTYGYDLIREASQTVMADAQVPHALLVDYGKGSSWVAVEVLALLEKTPVQYLYLESKTAEGRAVMQAAMGVSKIVVKGVF